MRILYLAAVSDEEVVERTLSDLLNGEERFDADRVRHAVRPNRPSVPTVEIRRAGSEGLHCQAEWRTGAGNCRRAMAEAATR